MKKTLALVLALVMMLALVACGGGTEPTAAPTDAPPPATEAPTQAPATEEPKGEEPEATEEPSNELPPADGEPLRIGHIVDLTGVEASTGQTAVDSLEFAAKYIGGQIGNRPIEIHVADARSESSVAADVAKQLVEEKGVDILFGPTQVGHKSAVANYVKEAQVPAIYYNATPPGLLSNPGGTNEWIVASGGVNDQMPTVMAAYVYEELGYRKVYTIAQDNTGGKSYIEPFEKVFTGLGGELVEAMYVTTGTTDYSAYLTKVSKDADGIVAWMSGSDAIALWSQWYEMGIYEDVPMVGTMHGGFTDYFVVKALNGKNPDMAAAMMEVARSPIFYGVSADTPENQDFVEAWKAEFGTIPPGSNLPGACAQAMLLLKAAVEATDGDTSPVVLRDALLAADIKGPEGHTYFADSQAATKDVFIVKVVEMDGGYNYETVKVYEDVSPAGYQP